MRGEILYIKRAGVGSLRLRLTNWMTNKRTLNPSAQHEVWALSAGTASCDVQHVCSMASACSFFHSFASFHHLTPIYSCGELFSHHLTCIYHILHLRLQYFSCYYPVFFFLFQSTAVVSLPLMIWLGLSCITYISPQTAILFYYYPVFIFFLHNM